MISKIVAADWILPISQPPIPRGAVVIEDGRIAWLGCQSALPQHYAQTKVMHRSGVMTPGLVNAHTHLQYSKFQHIGQASYRDFEDWCDAFEVEYDSITDPGHWAEAANIGVRMALATGTTVFSEIVTDDAARGAICGCCATGIEYLEVIGEVDATWQKSGRDAFLKRLEQPSETTTGISPHAPYSVDPNVIKDLMDIAADRGLQVHTHLAESAAEEALYMKGASRVLDIYGCLRDQFMLVREGGRGLQSATFADSLSLLSPKTHVAHGVYLDRSQRDLLLQRGTRVALCPRSNATIGLAEAPVAAYLEEGHDICVGTDSLSSCPSLDIMADVKLLADIAQRQGYQKPDLFARLVQAVTVAGARALGLADDGYGTLVQGGPADIAIFNVQPRDENIEKALVEQAEGKCSMTISKGKVVFDVKSENNGAA